MQCPSIVASAMLALLAGCAYQPAVLMRNGVAYPIAAAGPVERVCAGNIDQPGSAAYNAWGDGYFERIRRSDRRFGP